MCARATGPYAAVMSDEHLHERTLERRVLHEGHFITFRIDSVEDADGGRHTREVVVHPGAVCIIPLLRDEVLMVRQFRTPIGRILLELPAGTLDRRADGSVEPPLEAAPRELGEETGHRAERWLPLGTFWTAPGFADELMHLYLASGLRPLPDYSGPDVDERLELVHVDWREAVAMAVDGRISDAKSIIGLLRLARLAEVGSLPVD